MMIRFSLYKRIMLVVLALNIIGIITLYSALQQGGELVKNDLFSKQILWIIIGWLMMLIISYIDYHIYLDFAPIFYIGILLLLLFVELFGKVSMGAQRWIYIFKISFQPSELAKPFIVFALTRIFATSLIRERWKNIKIFSMGFILTLILFILILAQPDLGTASVILFIFIIMGISSYIPRIYFIILLAVGLIVSPLFWHILKPYQRERIEVFLNPNKDPLGAGYTLIQSKISIGSGRILGKGYLKGTQSQFNFMPERHTDFIFTVIGEEWGLVGSLFLLYLYYLLLRLILKVSSLSRDYYGYLMCVGFFAIFFIHIFVNIGMTLGILPVVGLPLIFISYGGTNMLVNYIMLGIILNILKRW